MARFILEEIMHPEDASAIAQMNSIPGFKTVSQRIIGEFSEKYAEIEFTGEGVSVTPHSMPRLYRLLVEATNRLGICEIPKMSTDWAYHISSFSVGEKNFRIVLQSGAVDLLTDDELLFLIGHELGHWISGHKPYHMLTEALFYPSFNTTEWQVLLTAIKFTLLNWYRISDYTADRYGLLCCKDAKYALCAMIKMAGLPKKEYDNINCLAFLKQAKDFEEQHSGTIDQLVKFMSITSATMPWMVKRASVLTNWYQNEGRILLRG